MQSAHRLASDSRDKVFSLLGLISPSFALSFKADYSMSIEEKSIKRLPKPVLSETRSLRFLDSRVLGVKTQECHLGCPTRADTYDIKSNSSSNQTQCAKDESPDQWH